MHFVFKVCLLENFVYNHKPAFTLQRARQNEARTDVIWSTWFDNFATSLKFRNVGVPNLGVGPYNNGLWTVVGVIQSQRAQPPSLIWNDCKKNVFPDDLFANPVTNLTRSLMHELQTSNPEFLQFFQHSPSKDSNRIPLRLPCSLTTDNDPANKETVFFGVRMEDQNIASNDALVRFLQSLAAQRRQDDQPRYKLYTVDSNIYKRILKVCFHKL